MNIPVKPKRGLKANLPANGTDGELIVTKDTGELYLGAGVGQPLIPLAINMPVTALTRQAIINGNFDIWQRGASLNNPAFGAYLADRFLISYSVDGGTFPANITHSRLGLTPPELNSARYAYRISPDGAGSAYGVNASYGIFQRIENATAYLCGAGKKLTISFWARSSIAGKRIGISFSQRYGSGGSPTAAETIAGQTITLTPTWTKYTITINTNTLSGKTFGTNNDDYLQIGFYVMWGTTAATTQLGGSTAESFIGAGNIDIGQAQVCAGDAALPFQPRSFADELQRCQRYFESLDFNAITSVIRSSTSAIYAKYPFKVQKRVSPTLSNASDLSTTNGTGSKQVNFFKISDNSLINVTGNLTVAGDSATYMTKNMGSITFSAATSFTGTAGDAIYISQTTKDTITGFDSEL